MNSSLQNRYRKIKSAKPLSNDKLMPNGSAFNQRNRRTESSFYDEDKYSKSINNRQHNSFIENN